MVIFGLGALALAAYLGFLAVNEYLNEKPQGFKDWVQFAFLTYGVASTVIVAVRSFF